MEPKTERRLVFTNHAWERIKECQLSGRDVQQLFAESILEDEKNVRRYKQGKYGNDHEQGIKHYRNGTLIFTIRETIDKLKHDPINLLITVADQRFNIKTRKHL